MFNRVQIFLLACCLVAFSIPSTAKAKPSAPIDIDNVGPENIQPGEEVRSVIRFTAKIDLQHVKVSLSPYSGIELLSRERHIEFTDLKRNVPREIEVMIRLTNETGYLSVFATTTNMAGGTRTKSIAIRYESVVDAMNRRPSREIEKTSSGKKLILLPASPR